MSVSTKFELLSKKPQPISQLIDLATGLGIKDEIIGATVSDYLIGNIDMIQGEQDYTAKVYNSLMEVEMGEREVIYVDRKMM